MTAPGGENSLLAIGQIKTKGRGARLSQTFGLGMGDNIGGLGASSAAV